MRTGTCWASLPRPGAWADPATGKVLMGARWYAPSAGDFTSADTVQVSPVPDPAAGDPFAYAGDDPLDAIDPTGHACLFGVCTPAFSNRLGHNAVHYLDVGRHAVAATADWGVSAGVDTVGNELKLIRAAAARIRDIPHVVVDAASSGIRKLGSAAARAITYVRPIIRAVTAPVRAGVRLVKTAIHKAVSVARKAGSAVRKAVSVVRRAASATAGFITRHATGIKQVAAAVGAVAFPALAPEALAVDAPFLQQHWRGVLQTALVAGAVGLTIANVLQLGLDPVTDAAEGADVGALAAGIGEEAASTAADTGATTAEESVDEGAAGAAGEGTAAAEQAAGDAGKVAEEEAGNRAARMVAGGVFGAAGGATSGYIQGQRGWKILADAGIGAASGALGGAPTNPYLQVGAGALTGLGNGAAQQLAANGKVVDWRGTFIDAGLGAGTAGIGIPLSSEKMLGEDMGAVMTGGTAAVTSMGCGVLSALQSTPC